MRTPVFLSILALTAAGALAKPALELVVTPEREAVHPKSRRETLVQIEIAAKPSREKRKVPLNLALVLDRSGSMTGAKLEKARQAASMAVDQLGKDDTFSLVVYDDAVEVLVPPRKVGDGREIKTTIEAIEPGGSTALYDGVKRGAAQLEKFFDDEKVNRVILLSDGLANVGPSSPRELAKLGKSLRKDGISVSTIGLGDDYNEDLMTALAEASHANYYYVRDAEKLPGIFREELGLAQSIVARKVRLVIRLAKGVEPVEVLGEDAAFEENTVRIPVEDLSGGQTRRFLVSCRVPADAEDAVALGDVALEYDDVDLGAAQTADRAVQVEVAQSEADSEATLETAVAQNAALTRNRLAKEQAIALADEGRAEAAADLLAQQAEINAGLPAAASSPALRKEATILGAAVSALRENGSFDKAERKDLEYQNYQDRRQKAR